MPPLDVTIDQLYWEDAEDAGITGILAVSREIFDRCTLTIMTRAEFASIENILHDIELSISDVGFANIDWQHTCWTEDYLIKECRFSRVDGPTMLAVATGDSLPTRYALKYIYLPMEEDLLAMRSLATYVFDDNGLPREAVNGAGGLRGQSIVVRRGKKAMNMGSTMVMYGSWDCWDCHGLGTDSKPIKVKGITQPRVYNPNGAVDETLNMLLRRHTDELNMLERQMVPSYAELRDRIAAKHDPSAVHRISERSSAFSASLTASYVIAPHNDSGLACETISFCSRTGHMPAGHEWLFAVGGHVHALPKRVGEPVLLFIKGTGLYHGTLPTSSSEPTFLHGNHGSALVTKRKMVEGLQRQRQRGDSTPPRLTNLPGVPVELG